MSSFSNLSGQQVIRDLICVITSNKSYLSEIDGLIGDGDHGINMSKGFSLCGERLTPDLNFSSSSNILGETLLTEIGGSMGPIYGTFFLELSNSSSEYSDITAEIFSNMLNSGLSGIQSLVDAKVGDKTLLDTLIPATLAFSESVKLGKDFSSSLDNCVSAAKIGWESTKDLVAQVGRASRLGERSRGVLDAGATSCYLILESMSKSIKTLL